MILSINDDCFIFSFRAKNTSFFEGGSGFLSSLSRAVFKRFTLIFQTAQYCVYPIKFTRQKEPQTRKTALSRLLAFSKL